MLNDAHPTYHAIQLLEAVVLEGICTTLKDFNEFVQPSVKVKVCDTRPQLLNMIPE